MSHIPSSAMPHAGSIHHDSPQQATVDQPPSLPAPSPPAPSRTGRRWPVAAIALGGALTLGAVAAAVALVRGGGGSKPKGKRGKGGKKRRNARR